MPGSWWSARGAGLELAAMANAQPNWCFTGVDPSPAMLDLARQAALPFADRVTLVAGTVDQSPPERFDGATCLLVLHFLDRDERLQTLREIRRRLQPGGRIVVAHHAPPSDDPERWMARSAAFGDRAASDPAKARATGKMMTERLPLIAPAAEEDVMREAGFVDVALFYAALSFRGWFAADRRPN